MKILGVMVMLILSAQQTPTIDRYNATNISGIVSVQPANRSLSLTANNAEAAFAGSQASNRGAGANVQLALSIWGDLNVMCRGGHGNRPETMQACCIRNKVDALLNNLGYCYHMGDTWRKCRPRDKRAQTVGLTDCVR
jgi:hypothetical protein